MSASAPASVRSSARSPAIDALRGLAIVTMIAANLAAPCLARPHPLWLRIYGSFAAPAFVFLSGLVLSLAGGRRPLAPVLRRGVFLLGIAAALDVVCWAITPFETFDVLYLIGLSLPLSALCLRLGRAPHLALALALVAATPWLRARLGYGPLLPDAQAYPWPAWRRLLVDGWFPIFPWLGVALLGSFAGRLRPLQPDASPRPLLAAGAFSMLLGGGAWWLAPPQLVTRAGYSELFYPPTLPYLAIALGSALLLLGLLSLLPRAPRSRPLAFLEELGRASLLVYVLHIALIAFLLDELFAAQPLPHFLLLYATVTLGLWCIARAIARLRRGASGHASSP